MSLHLIQYFSCFDGYETENKLTPKLYMYTLFHLTDNLDNFQVRVGNSTDINFNEDCGSVVTSAQPGSVRCLKTLRGRYVSIQLVGRTDSIQICEVTVQYCKSTLFVHCFYICLYFGCVIYLTFIHNLSIHLYK